MKDLFNRLKKLFQRVFLRIGYKEFVRGEGNVIRTAGALLSNVSFDIKGATQSENDYLSIEISTDGNQWREVNRFFLPH